jgi:PTS system nitrogen regulatory IIA component
MVRNMANDILTLDEVAEYLRVSERTVYNWAQKGMVPAAKIGTSWRFRKSDIDQWIDQKFSASLGRAQQKEIQLNRILSKERIMFLLTTQKREALLTLIDSLAETPEVRDREEPEREIFKREELMSTGIGYGIAIPHVRIPSISDLVGTVGISREGIEDYQSLDTEPIHIIIMLAGAYDQHPKYLKALSFLSSKLKNEAARRALLHTENEEEVFNLLTHGE